MNNTLTDRCVRINPTSPTPLTGLRPFACTPPIGTEGSTSVFSDVKNASRPGRQRSYTASP